MNIRVDVHVHADEAGPNIVSMLNGIAASLQRIEKAMPTNAEIQQQILQGIADTRAEVASVHTVEGSVKALLEGLNARIADLIAQGQQGTLDPSQILAALGDLKTAIVTEKDALAQDVVANTPAS